MAGYLFGWALLTFASNHPSASFQFVHQPEFTVWRAMTAAEVGLWMALLPHVIAWRRQMHSRCHLVRGLPRWVELSVAVMFLSLVAVPLLTTRSNAHLPLAHEHVRMIILYAVGLVVGIFVVLGVTGVYVALTSPHWEDEQNSAQHFLQDLQFLSSYKRRFLAVAGVMISVAVLTMATLQRAEAAYQRALLLGFGALFVAVLALIYLPCHLYIRQRGERLLDRCLTLDLSKQDVASQINARGLIRQELDLRRSARETLTDAVIILGPLLSGGLSLLISHS